MKIGQSTDKTSPFGGFNFCHKLLADTGIPQLVDGELGQRVKTFGFNYSDIFSNHLAVFLSGGDCTEDIQEHLHDHLLKVKGLSVCSADTILRGIKELASPVEELTGPTGVKHFFNINKPLNKLMVKALIKTGQLKTGSGTGYTLDYDNQVVPTGKYDALRTHKNCDGHQPGVASIGKLVVYLEGRNGNSQAKYQQAETPGRAFGLLEGLHINTERFRADSASYQQAVVELAERKIRYFYIRAMRLLWSSRFRTAKRCLGKSTVGRSGSGTDRKLCSLWRGESIPVGSEPHQTQRRADRPVHGRCPHLPRHPHQ